MVIFGKIAATWLFVCLYHLLLQSQFAVQSRLWKRVVIYGIGWIFLSAVSLLTDHVAVSVLAAAVAAGVSCWYLGNAKPVKAIGFGLLFAGLRLCAAGAAMFWYKSFPNQMERVEFYWMHSHCSL